MQHVTCLSAICCLINVIDNKVHMFDVSRKTLPKNYLQFYTTNLKVLYTVTVTKLFGARKKTAHEREQFSSMHELMNRSINESISRSVSMSVKDCLCKLTEQLGSSKS